MSGTAQAVVRRDPVDAALSAWFAVWKWSGVVVPALLLVLQPPQAAQVVIAVLLVGACVLGSSLEVEFVGLGNSSTFTPVSVAWVAAIVFLPPALAVATVALGELVVEGWRYRADISLFSISNSSMAVLLAASALHALSVVPPTAGEVFLVAMAATVLFEVVHQVTGATATVATGRGEFQDVFLDAPIATAFAVLLPPTALALVVPLPGSAVVTVLALSAFMVGSWLLLRVISSERARRMDAERVRQTMSRYFAPAIVEQLAEGEQMPSVGGEQREITVMFCDVRGFTRYAERRDPSEVVEHLNSLLADLVEIIFEHEGVLDKYVGDGFMAFWGAPVDQPDHALRASAAARRMVAMMRDSSHGLSIGLGINSGPAVIGNIGHPARVDYTAIGDTVNLAARLEGSTKQLGAPVVASDATVERLDPAERRFWNDAGSIRVAGRDGGTRVHVHAP